MKPALQVLAAHPTRRVEGLQHRWVAAAQFVPRNPERVGLGWIRLREEVREPDTRAPLASERHVGSDPMRPDQTASMVEPVQLRVQIGVAGQQHVVVAGLAEVPDGRHPCQVHPARFQRRIEVLQRHLERVRPQRFVVDAAHVQVISDHLQFGRLRGRRRLRGSWRAQQHQSAKQAQQEDQACRPSPDSDSMPLGSARGLDLILRLGCRESRLLEQPSVDLVPQRVDDFRTAGAQPPDRQAQLPLPSLRGPHASTEVRSDLLPAVEAAVQGAVGERDV